jgi:hypothetical protein
MAEMNPLRRRMVEDMKVHNLSPATQRCYVHAVAKFAQQFNRSPNRLGLAEIKSTSTSIGASWAGFNVAVCALRFFYGVTLGRSAMVDRIPYARKRRLSGRTTMTCRLGGELLSRVLSCSRWHSSSSCRYPKRSRVDL